MQDQTPTTESAEFTALGLAVVYCGVGVEASGVQFWQEVVRTPMHMTLTVTPTGGVQLVRSESGTFPVPNGGVYWVHYSAGTWLGISSTPVTVEVGGSIRLGVANEQMAAPTGETR